MFIYITIHQHEIGLVFRRGRYHRILTAGQYWLRWTEQLERHERTASFSVNVPTEVLLADEQLAQEVTIIEVADHEIVIHYEGKNFSGVLSAGKHIFWKSVIDRRFETMDLREIEVPKTIDRRLMNGNILSHYLQQVNITDYEKGILLLDGEFNRELTSGSHFFWRNGQVLSVLRADLRVRQLDISGQEMLTKDKAALRVNFHLQYQIIDINKALLKSQDAVQQLYLKVQLALREYVGTLTLDELLAKKEDVNTVVLSALNGAATALGINVLAGGIRDIILPGDVKEIMNQVLVAEKKAQANTILRREETASTRSLLNTAKLMEGNAMLQRLKEMEYVEKIAERINTISLSGGGQLVEQLREIFVK